MLTAESKEEVTNMFNRWKEEMDQKGLKINMEKTKMIVTGNKARIQQESHVDVVEEEWEQTWYYVWSVIYAVINDVQV